MNLRIGWERSSLVRRPYNGRLTVLIDSHSHMTPYEFRELDVITLTNENLFL